MQENVRHNKLLLFQVGPVKCSLDSNQVTTIIPPPQTETAGHTGRLPGIFRHDHQIVRVVDMRTKFGLSPSAPDRGKVIIVRLAKGSFAFWVDQVLNVIDQSDGRWEPLPAALPREVFTRTLVLADELILHTDGARMEAMQPSQALTEHIEQLERAVAAPPPPTPKAAEPAAPPPPITPPAPPPVTPTPAPAVASTPAAAAGPARTTPPAPGAPRPVPPAPARPPAPRPSAERTATPGLRPAAARPVPARPAPTPTVAPKTYSPPPGRPTPAPATTHTGYRSDPPAAMASAAPTPPRPSSEAGGSSGLVWLLLLLLLGAVAALVYYSTAPTHTPPPLARYQPPVAPEPRPAPAPPTAAAPAASDYHAAIEREERVVTITLNGPKPAAGEGEDEPTLLKPETTTAAEPAPAAPEPAADLSEPGATPEPAPAATPAKKAKRRQVTHTVVKGDTLWDIAERYVQDPFRYPELARLSGIKNPDLIYPGDIVRIVEE